MLMLAFYPDSVSVHVADIGRVAFRFTLPDADTGIWTLRHCQVFGGSRHPRHWRKPSSASYLG